MTDLFNRQQEEQETSVNQSSAEMPPLYLQKKDSPRMKKDPNGRNEENRIHKDISTGHIVPHDNAKNFDREQTTSNLVYKTSVDQLALIESLNTTNISSLSNENLSSYTDKNSHKGDLPTIIDESGNSITIKKRTTPASKAHLRRRAYQNQNPTTNELLKVQASTISNKNTYDRKKTATKRSEKSIPIFIPPKKSSTSLHGYCSTPLDNPLHNKRKSDLKQQSSSADSNIFRPTTNCTQNQSKSPMHGGMQSPTHSYEEYSSDDSDNESLLIRQPKSKIIDEKAHSPIPFHMNIPSAIYITDPSGCSHKFDLDTDIVGKNNHHESIWDDDSNDMDTNTLSPNVTYDISSSSEILIIDPLPSPTPIKHSLHSIGEEEEEDDQNHNNSKIFSKELDRIEALNRSREIMFNGTIDDDNEETQNESNENLRVRRSSDPNLDKSQLHIQTSPITKASSATSIPKQTVNPSVKVSITKYLLMKLHLTSSSQDNESNISSAMGNSPKRRLVRRSSNKKRYQTQ